MTGARLAACGDAHPLHVGVTCLLAAGHLSFTRHRFDDGRGLTFTWGQVIGSARRNGG